MPVPQSCRRILLALGLLAAPLFAQDVTPTQDLAWMDKVESLEARRTALDTELAGLVKDDPKDEKRRTTILNERIVVEDQLGLLKEQVLNDTQQAASTDAVMEELARERDRRAQPPSPLRDPLAELAGLRDLETLRQRVRQAFDDPLNAVTAARDGLARELVELETALRGLPARRALVEANRKTKREERARFEAELAEASNPEDEVLLRRRILVRDMSLRHLQQLTDLLGRRGPVLERAIEWKRLQLAIDDLRLGTLRQDQAAARQFLAERVAVAQASAESRLAALEAELAGDLPPHVRIRKVLERDAHRAAVRTLAVTVSLDAERAADKAAKDARTALEQERDAQELGQKDNSDAIRERILDLQESVRRIPHDELLRGLRLRQAGIADERATAAGTQSNRATAVAAARASAEALSAGLSPIEQQREARLWDALAAEVAERDGELVQALTRLHDALDQRRTTEQELHDARRTYLVILQRANLFLRGQSNITLAALRAAGDDLLAIPSQLPDLGGRFGQWTRAPGVGRAVLMLVGALLAAFAALWFIERRVRRVLEQHRYSAARERALRLLRGLVRSLCILATFWLPTWMLPGLSAGLSASLLEIGLLLASLWMTRRVLLEATDRPGDDARRIRVAGRWLLRLAMGFQPVILLLRHLGYHNEGAIDLLAMAWRVLSGVVLFALLWRRSTLVALMPRGTGALARILRLGATVVHPFILLLVPGLIVLDALQYDILAGLIAGASVEFVVVTVLAVILYHGLRALATARLAAKDDEDDDEADERPHGYRLQQLVAPLTGVGVFLLAAWVLLTFGQFSYADVYNFLDIALPLQTAAEGSDLITVWDVLVAIAIVYLTVHVTRHVKGLLRDLVLPHTRFDAGLQYTITVLVGYVMIALGGALALGRLFDLASLGYVVAALSIGIGFGLQEIVSNFISGLILLFERPLRVGDLIEVDGREGTVARIQIRATTIQTRDNHWILVPNKTFITQSVTNLVYTDAKIRLRTRVGVAYGSDTSLVRKVLLEVAENHKQVLRRPPPEVWFVNFGDSSLDFDLLCWVANPIPRWRIQSDLRFAIDAAFRRHDITIPFPQRDLHLKTVEATLPLRRDRTPPEAPAAGDPG